jgi:lipopolysaccharide exporter
LKASGSADQDEKPLAYRATRGGLWVAVGSYFSIGFGFLANLALTRLLTPEHFGIFSLGTFFFTLINLQPKIGVGYAFGQRQETTGELIGTHLALDITAGIVTLLLAGAATPILRALGYSQDVVWVMLALAMLGVLSCLGNTAFLLLEKALYFRQTSLLNSLVIAFSYLPALWLAMHHGGYWSLIIQNVANVLPMLVGVWWLARRQMPFIWQLGWQFDRALAQGLLRFGVVVGLSGLFTMITMSADNFLVGTFVSIAALGFYDRAYRLAEWPNKLVTGVVTRTAFYTYARLQNDRLRLQKAAGMITWMLVMITIPVALILFTTAPDAVALLYGDRWLPSALFLRFLVIYSLARPLLDNAGSLFISTGHPRRSTTMAIIQALTLTAIATPLTVLYGTVGTCVGVGISFLVALLLAWRYARQTLTLPLWDIFGAPVVAAAMSLLAYLFLTRGFNLNALSLPVRIGAKASLVSLTFCLTVLAIQPRQLIERAKYVWRLLRAKEDYTQERTA